MNNIDKAIQNVERMKNYIIDIVGGKKPSLMSIPPREIDFDILGFELLDEYLVLKKQNKYMQELKNEFETYAEKYPMFSDEVNKCGQYVYYQDLKEMIEKYLKKED